VDYRGNIGYTSNIAGMMTITFDEGYNTFSMPLAPFEDLNASDILASGPFTQDSDTIYHYDPAQGKWLGHPKILPAEINDFPVVFGEGYMLYLTSGKVRYTFTGSTGTSIRFIAGVGSESPFKESLNITVIGDDVELSWEPASGVTGYNIYKASKRMDNDSLTDYNMNPVDEVAEEITTWTDSDALSGNSEEFYYMIVARDYLGERSSTFALGVKVYNTEPGYASFAPELNPETAMNLSSFTRDTFLSDSDSIYYYDERAGTWRGHPRFLPENINNSEVVTGSGYMIFTYTKTTRIVIIGG
jgi:hypothetical protein